ncbi:3-dehydroquinate synthase [Paenisporosarcina sp. TG20]|uniref:3-dehydroquinate synthase n=1 Tax=Paenisporosarcina sp. TG20 TaxID=1211706 RepID=UPI0003046DB4|nr:3-dehydroquinate synthase [Paenisporosarcina sp. TG20]
MQTISIDTKNKHYNVYVGSGIYETALPIFEKQLQRADHVVIFVDEVVAKLHLEKLLMPLQAIINKSVHVFELPAGETSKSIETFMACHSFLLEVGCTRKSIAFALGGGACGDVVGFVASTFMRGIPFFQCPTTILAHDSAVGGKTAINHPQGKNMIGSFYQPEAVIYDILTLSTLPKQEILSGMAEVIKHALISDEHWVEELVSFQSFDEISAAQYLSYLVKGIEVKAAIVEADEFELSVRKYLNLGHTYGHAIEASTGYGRITHGESVAIGLVIALLLSEKVQSLEKGNARKLFDGLCSLGYSFAPVLKHEVDTLISYMKRDKKASFGDLHFVLLEQIGQPCVQIVTVDDVKLAHKQLNIWIREVYK